MLQRTLDFASPSEDELRRFATAAARNRDETGDLALVADHLRHSSLDTARDYAKANNMKLNFGVARSTLYRALREKTSAGVADEGTV